MLFHLKKNKKKIGAAAAAPFFSMIGIKCSYFICNYVSYLVLGLLDSDNLLAISVVLQSDAIAPKDALLSIGLDAPQ